MSCRTAAPRETSPGRRPHRRLYRGIPNYRIGPYSVVVASENPGADGDVDLELDALFLEEIQYHGHRSADDLAQVASDHNLSAGDAFAWITSAEARELIEPIDQAAEDAGTRWRISAP